MTRFNYRSAASPFSLDRSIAGAARMEFRLAQLLGQGSRASSSAQVNSSIVPPKASFHHEPFVLKTCVTRGTAAVTNFTLPAEDLLELYLTHYFCRARSASWRSVTGEMARPAQISTARTLV